MRPEQFSSGNPGLQGSLFFYILASMRPEQFSSGNLEQIAPLLRLNNASMRPEQFSSGNPEIIGRLFSFPLGFNEAGAIQLRKSRLYTSIFCSRGSASMRPEQFSSGNLGAEVVIRQPAIASMRPEQFSSGNLYNPPFKAVSE